MKLIRKATVSGMFYDAGEIELNNQIKTCFFSENGPGTILERNIKKQQLKGVIVPHAGYPFSGSIAAYAYDLILDAGFADVFIIIGPNHSGMGSGVAMSSKGSWETPLGNIPVDEEIVQRITGGIIDPDDHTMKYQENSIEVQLPFLQYISKGKPFSIVPIAMIMQDYETARDIGIQLADAIQKEKRNVILIASTDFSHEGITYGRMSPRNSKVNEYVYKQDTSVIEMIKKMNPAGLIDTVDKNNISMCGSGPVAAVLTASKKLGSSSVELLKYGTSYDVHPDSSACVGYASFAIY
ncbi:AmmeMemoRadiSam system protein B [Thermoplasmatales archaeon ex4572_165]|nr:MAG: AmmeMemoRadiSam system protein B [Thermoplasmatales archaeon ex4572_165]